MRRRGDHAKIGAETPPKKILRQLKVVVILRPIGEAAMSHKSTPRLRAGRIALLFLAIGCVAATTTLALAQAQPLIVFVGRSVLGGFLSGIGHRAGEEAYDRMRGTNQGAQVPSSNSSPSEPPTSPQLAYPSPAPMIPSDGLRWTFRNLHPNIIGMQFYTKIPNGRRVWPAGGRAYLFNPGDEYTLRLRCVPGELVCFGAWSQGKYWGTGYQMRTACHNCCRMCGTDGGRANLR